MQTEYTVSLASTRSGFFTTIYAGSDWAKAFTSYGATCKDALKGQEVKLTADGKLQLAASI